MQVKKFTSQPIQPTFWLSLILITGFFARIYQLGRDSLWNDEVGVALAASQTTFSAMLQAAHNHVMAMPLDYAIVWLFARLNTSEAFLRLPAALWGTLSIVVAYGFFSRLSNQRIGLLAALFLALSPFHVQYSQELRFYASLVFFYLAASWLLLHAVEQPTAAAWIKFTLVTILGIYFHVYVILVLVNGLVWLVIGHWKGTQRNKQRVYFIRSASMILCAFLIGVIFFGAVYSYDIPLVMEDTSLLSVISTGLGWLPFDRTQSTAVLIWGFSCLILECIAIVSLLIRKPRSLPVGMFYGALLQLGAIIVMNALKQYFVAPRQFIQLLPGMLFFAAYGLDLILQKVIHGLELWRSQKPGFSPSHAMVNLLYSLAAIVILVVSLPALSNYYQDDKGSARNISQYINDHLGKDDIVLVIPDYEAQMIDYYYDETNASAKSSPIYGASWDDLQEISKRSGAHYLVTKTELTSSEIDMLVSLGYQQVFESQSTSRYARSVWVDS